MSLQKVFLLATAALHGAVLLPHSARRSTPGLFEGDHGEAAQLVRRCLSGLPGAGSTGPRPADLPKPLEQLDRRRCACKTKDVAGSPSTNAGQAGAAGLTIC